MRGNTACVVAALVACGCGREKLTGIDLTVTYDPQLNLDQLLLSGLVNGDLVFGPALRPERAEPLTSGSTTLLILLPAERDGQTLSLYVAGMQVTVEVASGNGEVEIVEAELIPHKVALAAGAAAACDNGVDDDEDGEIDINDPGCSDTADGDERCDPVDAACADCDNGQDDDADGVADYLQGAQGDPGCSGPADDNEKCAPGPDCPECDDGVENELLAFQDGNIDYPADTDCDDPWDDSETPGI